MFPAEQIKFLDENNEETSVFRIAEDGIVIYNIPDYVNKANPDFTYYIEFEPDLYYEFDLIQEYYSDDCNNNVMFTIQVNLADEVYILYPDQVVEVFIDI